jgi:anti-sigma factor ChrR (cupin superfamily)
MTDRSRLPPELRTALDAQLGRERGADDALIARVRGRVMAAIRAEAPAPNRTVRSGESGWQTLMPGLECKVLWSSGDVASCFLRAAPGVTIPRHRHSADEECVVLEGSVRIGRDLILHPGDFHIARQGGEHEEIRTDTGALVYLRGALDFC